MLNVEKVRELQVKLENNSIEGCKGVIRLFKQTCIEESKNLINHESPTQIDEIVDNLLVLFVQKTPPIIQKITSPKKVHLKLQYSKYFLQFYSMLK